MSRYTKYTGTEDLEVTDYEYMQKFIRLNKAERCNGFDFSHLFKIRHYANPKENKLDWSITIGRDNCDKVEDFTINHFDPADPTVQIFFSEIAKFTKPFKIYAFDEEFPIIGDDNGPYAWELWSDEKGQLHINDLYLVRAEKEHTDISQADPDEYEAAMEETELD